MFNYSTSRPALSACTFTRNTSAYGGGMVNTLYASSTLDNCTFIENFAIINGGGMFNSLDSSPVLTECLLTENTSKEGGGISSIFSARPWLTDTVVCNNTVDQIDGQWYDFGGNTISDECPECPADFNGDGIVDGYELNYLLGAWDTDDQLADLDDDGTVDGADLSTILGAWGVCP